MNKKDIIKFITIFTLFVFYHFIYIYYNQASTINGDTIWAYSFSRDIIGGVDISEFSFPPLYYFLDVVVSFLPSLFGDHLIHSILVSPVNILILIFFFSFVYKSKTNNELLKIITLLIFSTLIVYYSNILLSYLFALITNVNIYPLILLNNYFYVPGNHGLSSVMAILLAYLFYFKEKNLENRKLLYLSVFIFSFSDFWFAIYFLPIIGFFYLFNIKKKFLIEICLLTTISLISLLVTYYTNESLKNYRFTKVNLPVNNDINLVETLFLIYVLPIIFFLYLIYKKRASNFIKSLFLGSLISVLFIVLTENYSHVNMRYYMLILPLNIILIFEVLKLHIKKINKVFLTSLFFLILGIAQIITFNITDNKLKNEHSYLNFKDEIQCIKKIPNFTNFTMVADYWAGKIIMESLDRKVNWITLNTMYNPSWAKFNKATNSIIIVNFRYYPDGNIHKDLKYLIENKKVDAQFYCKNKLIIIENFKAQWKQY